MSVTIDLNVQNSFPDWIEKINQLGVDIDIEITNASKNVVTDTFIGATASSNGVEGMVPAPNVVNQALCGDGSWKYFTNVQQNIINEKSKYLLVNHINNTIPDMESLSYIYVNNSNPGRLVFSGNMIKIDTNEIDGTIEYTDCIETPIIYDGITTNFNEEYGNVSFFGRFEGGTLSSNISIDIPNFVLMVGSHADIRIDGALDELTSLNINISNTGSKPVTYGGDTNFDFSKIFSNGTNVFSVVYNGTSYEIISDHHEYGKFMENYVIIAPNKVLREERRTDVIKFKVGAGLHNSAIELYYAFHGETGTYQISSFSASDSNYEQLRIENYHGSNAIFFVIHATDTFGNIVTFGKIIPAESLALKLPELTSPVDGASPTSFTATTDAFTVYGGTDTHVSTDWKVTSDPYGKLVLAEALGSSDLTSHEFTLTNTVSEGQKLYVWAQHNGQTLGASGWNVTEFTPSFSRHGEVLYDTNGDPAAVIIGSYASGGTEPWNIRGRRVWLAVACMSKRPTATMRWGIDSADLSNNSNIEDADYIDNSLGHGGSGSGYDDFITLDVTEAQIDNAWSRGDTSKFLTDNWPQIFPAINFCRSISVVLDGQTVQMDCPSIDALMRMCQACDIIDIVDPTLTSSGYVSTKAWWNTTITSSTEHDIETNGAIRGAFGDVVYESKIWQVLVFPVIEIEA